MVLSFKILIFISAFSFSISSNVFKNVKVLDIESRSEMKKYMKSISKDLGVKCSYCHDMDDKSIDTPEKEITREMIKLTKYLNSLLNDQLADSSSIKTFISCWTCHYGNLSPANKRPEDH